MEPITEAEAMQFLADAPVAHIGVVSEGRPYVTPMSFVVDDGRILFRTKPGQRFLAIRENPAVSIEVSTFDPESGEWTSVVVRGTARTIEDEELSLRTVDLLLDKYRAALGSPLGRGGLQPMSSFPHVIEVEIEEITGMASGRGLTIRTRPGRL